MELLIFIVLLIFIFVLPLVAMSRAGESMRRVRELEEVVRGLANRGKVAVRGEVEREVPSSVVRAASAVEPVERRRKVEKPVGVPQAKFVAPVAEKKSERVAEEVGDGESLEMRLGTYWFVRIGVVLLLTGAGTLAYYRKDFFFELPPLAKVAGLYFLSLLLGVGGFLLQRVGEKLKNYGQVLLAGGVAGVYFTTYAAHLFEPVRVIPDPAVALCLLFGWGAVMVWVADRMKSETLGLFAVGASFYATYVPLIHGGAISSWMILASNLILAIGAVVFMVRNRWLKLPVLSLVAAYGGFFLWRMRVLEEPSLGVVVLFGAALWFVFNAAVFLSDHVEFGDARRSAFLTSNNGAVFGLLSWEVLVGYPEKFWILPLVVGSVLLLCALVARWKLAGQVLSRQGYLVQGLTLVTLGMMSTQLAESVKGAILGAESVVLLLLAIRNRNVVVQVGAMLVAAVGGVFALAAVWDDVWAGREGALLGAMAFACFALFNSWACHRWLEIGETRLLRRRVSYFAGLGLAVLIGAFLPEENAMRLMLVAAVLLSLSVHVLGVREFGLLAVGVAGVSISLSAVEACKMGLFDLSILAGFSMVLGLLHWWQWGGGGIVLAEVGGDVASKVRAVVDCFFSAGTILLLLCGLSERLGFGGEAVWVWLGPVLSVGLLGYGAVTRAPWIGVLGQVLLGIASFEQVRVCAVGEGGDLVPALLPIAALLLTAELSRWGVGAPAFVLRAGRGLYRIVAGVLGLFWMLGFVAGDFQVLALVGVAVGFVLLQSLAGDGEWYWLATGYVAFAGIGLVEELEDVQALWQSIVAIGLLMGMQLVARRSGWLRLPEAAQQVTMVGCAVAMFFWVTVRVAAEVPMAEAEGAALRSIVWAGIAVLHFALGLGLKERGYRLMGLGTLAVALLSLVPIVWGMSTEWRIASFFVIGGVFVMLGFVYNHHRERFQRLL